MIAGQPRITFTAAVDGSRLDSRLHSSYWFGLGRFYVSHESWGLFFSGSEPGDPHERLAGWHSARAARAGIETRSFVGLRDLFCHRDQRQLEILVVDTEFHSDQQPNTE